MINSLIALTILFVFGLSTELLHAAAAIEALQSKIAEVNAGRSSPVTKQRWISRLRFEAAVSESRGVVASKDLVALMEMTDRWERDWQDGQLEQAIRLFANASAMMSPYAATNSAASLRMERYADLAMDRIPTAPFEEAEFCRLQFSLVHPWTGKALVEILDREKLLNSYVGLQQRMEDYVRVPLSEHVSGLGKRTSPETLRMQIGLTQEQINNLDPQIINEFAYRRHEQDRKYLTDTNYVPSRIEQSAQHLAAFVQARFTMDQKDLRLVRRALDKHVTDPILRDRLVQLIYRGQNPFLGLPEDSATEAGGPSLAALTRKSAATVSGVLANGGSRGRSASAPDPATVETVQSTSPRSLPFLPLAAVLAAGLVLCWFISRSRPG